jgi:hypothetical protein
MDLVDRENWGFKSREEGLEIGTIVVGARVTIFLKRRVVS